MVEYLPMEHSIRRILQGLKQYRAIENPKRDSIVGLEAVGLRPPQTSSPKKAVEIRSGEQVTTTERET
jgi:hypothetical protein